MLLIMEREDCGLDRGCSVSARAEDYTHSSRRSNQDERPQPDRVGIGRCLRSLRRMRDCDAQEPVPQHSPQRICGQSGRCGRRGCQRQSSSNLGERHCEIFCEGAGSSMMMHFEAADIHRPLLSLSRAAVQGFKSHLDWYGGYLEDTKTGEAFPIQRSGNLYIMQIWVRGSAEPHDPNADFARRG